MDKLRDPRISQTKLSLEESGHLHSGPRPCPREQTSIKFSLQAQGLECLTKGCCLELGLGKCETLSGPQPLNPGRSSPSSGSIAAQTRGGFLLTVQELQILSGPEPLEALRHTRTALFWQTELHSLQWGRREWPSQARDLGERGWLGLQAE